MSHKEYVIFCDESDAVGKYYSDFYGGLIVGSSDFDAVNRRLTEKKASLNLFAEVKWSKVTERYLDKYLILMDAFFEEVRNGVVRVRIMFRQNACELQKQAFCSREERFFKLYYQFIKHAFGLGYRNGGPPCWLRIHFDQLPHTKEGAAQFKGYIHSLRKNPDISKAGFSIREEDISEYRSHDHVLAQCLDVVLGSMSFRLNDKHLEKEPGKRTRGKKTIAKEKLYKAILTHIRSLRPGFNIGISTGNDGDAASRWSAPYQHWSFKPNGAEYDFARTKSKAPRHLQTPDA